MPLIGGAFRSFPPEVIPPTPPGPLSIPDISIIVEFEDVLVEWDRHVSEALGSRPSQINESARSTVISQLKHPPHTSFIQDLPCSNRVRDLWSWLHALQAAVLRETCLTVQISICLGGCVATAAWCSPQKQRWVLRHLGPAALVHAVCNRNRCVVDVA